VPPGRPYPIAFLLTSFDVGGTERQMVELMCRLDRRLFEVHVACFHLRGPLASRLAGRASSIAYFPIRRFAAPSTVRQMRAFASWCRRIRARVVHTCELYANVFGLPAAALAGVDVRIGNRRELVTPDKSLALLACQRAAYGAAHVVVANSAAAAERLRREFVPASKIQIIANGVDSDAFAPSRSARPLRRIVMVANLREEKGHDTLIDAAPRIRAAHPDATILLVGDGPLRETLRRRVAALGLDRAVEFAGERQDVAALLSSSDVFVLPSRSEASPNGVLEAMASGLPIVASRVGGIPELVDSGIDGVLVEPNDPAALADAVIDLMDRPEWARVLGRAARERAEDRHGFDRMVARFERLYLTALGQQALAFDALRPARVSDRRVS
jgi:glycosyltransferase involved in cell wall biosynthesis